MDTRIGEALRLANECPQQTVAELAHTVGLSVSYFTRLFKQQTGCPPKSYLRTLILRQAEDLLRNTELPVWKVASKLKLRDAAYFGRVFKRTHNGEPPGAFRRKQKKAEKSH